MIFVGNWKQIYFSLPFDDSSFKQKHDGIIEIFEENPTMQPFVVILQMLLWTKSDIFSWQIFFKHLTIKQSIVQSSYIEIYRSHSYSFFSSRNANLNNRYVWFPFELKCINLIHTFLLGKSVKKNKKNKIKPITPEYI